MVTYIYDGSWEGLLTAIYQAYYSRETPDKILSREDCQSSFFQKNIAIVTDGAKAEKVSQSVISKISPQAWRHSLCAFLSEKDDVGTWIFHYLKFGWQIGPDVDRHLADPRVLKIHQLSQKVSFERHRMLGLIRFQQIEARPTFLYAPYAPDNNITALVAPHFARRLAGENWIIHDQKRGLAAFYNQKAWIIVDFDPEHLPEAGSEEVAYQQLWQAYFRQLSIEQRFNPQLQKKNMPMRYWRFLTEKNPLD